MIPREFFDWMAAQWWGMPAFVVVVIATLVVGGILIGGAMGERR